MFAYELQRRLDKTKSTTIAVAAHPGGSTTNLWQHIPAFIFTLFKPLMLPFMHSPKKGALPILYAAIGTDVKGGEYFGPTGFNEFVGKPGKVKSKPQSYDQNVAKKLWEVSEKMLGIKFEI